MKILAFAALCLIASPAMAQSLDLKLHSQDVPAAPSTSTGVYYGDVGGKGTQDSGATIHGSVGVSVGHTEGWGTSKAVDARLHIRHAFDGHMDLDIGVLKSDGVPTRGHSRAPWPY